MKTITIEHNVEEGWWSVTAFNGNTIIKGDTFQTFDEAVNYVKENLL